MKKLMTVLLIAAVTVSFVGITHAEDHGQYVLAVKAPKFSIGQGYQIELKGCYFSMTDYAQKWAYFGLKKGVATAYVGHVSDWAPETVAFTALKIAPTITGPWTGLTDFHFIKNGDDLDLYDWSTIEYNTMLDGKPVYIGPQVELIRTAGITKCWAGIHIGSPDLVEVGIYYHEKGDWALRTMFVVQL